MTKLLIKWFIKEDSSRDAYGKLAGGVGLVTNLVLSVAKIIIGVLASSIAILADGINNLTDTSSSIVTLLGFHFACKPADDEHPYGHARLEYIAGMIVSFVVMLVGVLLFRESIIKIMNPSALKISDLSLGILLASMLVKLWQSIFYFKLSKIIDSAALKALGVDSRNDIISTGMVLVSLLVYRNAGYNLDGWLGAAVAVFIILSGIQLVRETSSPLLGESPSEELIEEIAEFCLKKPGVLGVHDLMVHNYGPDKIFASIHIEIDAKGDLLESHEMMDELERDIKKHLKIEFVAHMDPIVVDDPLLKDVEKPLHDYVDGIEGLYNLHDLRAVKGPHRTNIIFDVVRLESCEKSQKEIRKEMHDVVQAINPNYNVVITFDKRYNLL